MDMSGNVEEAAGSLNLEIRVGTAPALTEYNGTQQPCMVLACHGASTPGNGLEGGISAGSFYFFSPRQGFSI